MSVSGCSPALVGPDPILTVGRVAAILRMAPRTVSKLIDSGSLPGYRIPGGNHRRVFRSELVRYIKDNRLPDTFLLEAEQLQ